MWISSPVAKSPLINLFSISKFMEEYFANGDVHSCEKRYELRYQIRLKVPTLDIL